MTDLELVMNHLNKQPQLKLAMIKAFEDTEFDETNPHPPTAFEIQQTRKQLEKIIRHEIYSTDNPHIFFCLKGDKSETVTLVAKVLEGLWFMGFQS